MHILHLGLHEIVFVISIVPIPNLVESESSTNSKTLRHYLSHPTLTARTPSGRICMNCRQILSTVMFRLISDIIAKAAAVQSTGWPTPEITADTVSCLATL